MYSSRKSWWQHETERHLIKHSWICKPCEQEGNVSAFETSASFADHIAERHKVKLNSAQLSIIRDMCQKDAGRCSPSEECPLCQRRIPREPNASMKRIDMGVKRHVSRHLEQLALFVASSHGQLSLNDGDSEFQDDSDFEDGLQSEIDTIASRDTRLTKKDIHVANLKAFIADQQRTACDVSNTIESAAIPSETTVGDRRRSIQTQDFDIKIPAFPVWVQLPPPNEHFYSRSHLLLDLDRHLSPQGATCIVYGVGGVGKTLCAIQYSHIHKAQYDAIFWLPADTAPGLTDSYLQMAVALGLADSSTDYHLIMAKVCNWLQETGKTFWCKVAPSSKVANNVRKTLASYLR